MSRGRRRGLLFRYNNNHSRFGFWVLGWEEISAFPLLLGTLLHFTHSLYSVFLRDIPQLSFWIGLDWIELMELFGLMVSLMLNSCIVDTADKRWKCYRRKCRLDNTAYEKLIIYSPIPRLFHILPRSLSLFN
jgi:hypothetical protein